MAVYISKLDTIYSLSTVLRSSLVSEYGLEMASKLVSLWGDAALLRSQLEQYYGDAPVVRSQLISRWADALQFRTKLVSLYSLAVPARSALVSEYSIMGGLLISILESYWDIRNVIPLISKLVSSWSILDDESITIPVTLSMTIAGVAVDPEYIGRERHRDQYKINCEAHFREQSAALLAEKGAPVVIVAGSETTNLVVKKAGRQRRHGDQKWIVSMVSASIALEDPDGDLLSGSYGGLMASVLVNQWAATVGLSIGWEIEDWLVPVDAVTANDQRPLDLIRSLLDEAEAILQTDIDGSVVVRYYYETSIPALATATPDICLTDNDDFISTDEDTDDRPGYNKYLITDETAAGPTVQLGQMECNGVTYVTASIVPWGSYETVELGSSHSGVQIGLRQHEIQTINQKNVEFVAGVASASHPVYGSVTADFATEDLGTVTGDESKNLTAAVAEESLADIEYQTQFYKWRVDVPDTAQLILTVE